MADMFQNSKEARVTGGWGASMKRSERYLGSD